MKLNAPLHPLLGVGPAPPPDSDVKVVLGDAVNHAGQRCSEIAAVKKKKEKRRAHCNKPENCSNYLAPNFI